MNLFGFLKLSISLSRLLRALEATGERIQSEDATRLEAQKEQLGAAGRTKAGEELAQAEEENEVDTPEEVRLS